MLHACAASTILSMGSYSEAMPLLTTLVPERESVLGPGAAGTLASKVRSLEAA
jgi:hypothetical protein